MAGAYPDAPSRRMAWDADGSVGLLYDINFPEVELISTTDAQTINSEDENSVEMCGGNHDAMVNALFPEKREVDGFFASISPAIYRGTFEAVGTSTNVTSGLDGTWSTAIGDYSEHETVNPTYRTTITSLAISNVRGIRLACEGRSSAVHIKAFHVYGTITPGETPDRLIFLDTLNSDAVFTKVLDYGDVPRGQTQARTFKVKNNSSAKQANTVQVTAEDLHGGAGAWYTFSDDDVSYQATFPVGNLGTGATKLLYIKQIVPDAQTPGAYAARIKANQASWT